ncbi:transporter substrate-binding domain-containing protein [Streptomyces sp. NPDC012794]|uniref:transporter substrate-binding domain-containing protein n=1 Tax=Streptomyces sp. NPDC012794 TaxID=3364850 RepID=UPI0036A28898
MVTGQTQIPMVQNGTVDLVCGAIAHTAERARQADFSNTVLLDEVRIVAKAGSAHLGGSLAGLAGQRVTVAAGSLAEGLVKAANADQQLGMNIMQQKDTGEAFALLEAGRAVAMVDHHTVLEGQCVGKGRTPADWAVSETPLQRSALAFIMRKGDEPFRAVVNEAIAAAQTGGEAAKLYSKWFQSPIPPRSRNLGMELSADNEALFSSPKNEAIG